MWRLHYRLDNQSSNAAQAQYLTSDDHPELQGEINDLPRIREWAKKWLETAMDRRVKVAYLTWKDEDLL